MDRPARACSWLPLLSTGVAAFLAACGDDLTPIRFEDVRVEEVSPYRAVVRFETSREASCHVLYGIAAGALDNSATDPDMEPGTLLHEHEVPLEDLEPQTEYFFAALAEDADGVEYLSDTDSFTTGDGGDVDSMTNVASLDAGSSVTAVSSNWGGGDNDSSWGANNAVDGEMSTEWSSQGDGTDAFLELDLGETREVRVIGFRSRKMSDGTSIILRFELLVDGETTIGPFEAPDPDTRYLFPLEEGLSMRTVRMNALDTTGGNTGLKELELFVP